MRHYCCPSGSNSWTVELEKLNLFVKMMQPKMALEKMRREEMRRTGRRTKKRTLMMP